MSKDKNIHMKNTQKGILFTVGVIFNVLRDDGLIVTVKKISKSIYHKLLGVDFSMQELNTLTIKGSNQEFGTICGSSAEDTVRHVLDELVGFDKSVIEGSFVDFGSGKGRLIIFAKEYGFNKCVGIEFAKELYERSIKNINLLKVKNCEVLHMDALDYVLKEDTRVIYFLNPFHQSVFEKVLPRIISQTKEFKKDIYIVYRAPIYKSVFLQFPEIRHIKSDVFNSDATEFYKIDSIRT